MMIPNNYYYYLKYIFLFFSILTIYWIIQINKYKIPKNLDSYIIKENEFDDYNNQLDIWSDDFKNIGLKYGTDKIFKHHYERLYGTVLGPLRNKKLNFLEIGLGCGMPYGPGKSILLWKEYLPNSEISILEYEKECAEKFRNQLKNLYIGDQSNFEVLKKVGEGGPYDIIIDDGSHVRKHIINSLIGLFPYLKSGGKYIIEDLFFSFIKGFDNQEESAFDFLTKLNRILHDPRLVTNYLTKVIKDGFNYDEKRLKDIAEHLESITCFRKACVLTKL